MGPFKQLPCRRFTFSFIFMFIFLGIIYPNTTYAATTITVNSTADGDLTALNGNGTCDLREAIEAANTNATVGECIHDGSAGTDTIEFAVNGTFTRTVTPELIISDDVQIIGNGAASTILSKSSALDGRILSINRVEVLIDGITISDGNISTDSKRGGGISIARSADVTISNSVLKNNKASRSGGAIYIYELASLTLENSRVDGNESTAEDGGGIMVASQGNLIVTNSTISNNIAYGLGGGVANNGDTRISQTTISGNKSGNKGGGVDTHGTSNLVIENSTISGNESGTKQDVSYGTGGGVNQGDANSVVSINNTTIFNNWNNDGGGGIRRHTGGTDTLTVRNSIIAGNEGSSGANDCIDDGGSGIVSDGNNILIAGEGCVAVASDVVLPDVATLLTGLNSALANNGGSTQTHALLKGSSAINNGDPATCLAVDQRGETRDSQCDIGAYEMTTTTTTTTTKDDDSDSNSKSDDDDDDDDDNTVSTGTHVSTCMKDTGDNTTVSSVVDLTSHGIECQIIDAAGIGVQSVMDSGFVRGIDIWGPLNFDVKVCLRGSGSLLFLDARNAPRVAEHTLSLAEGDFTCTTISRAGMVALVTAGGPSPTAASQPVASQSAAPANTVITGTPLTSCRVTTTDMLNFRDAPSANSGVKTIIPYDMTLQAINKVPGWYNVIFGDDNGWISADHVNTRGNCG